MTANLRAGKVDHCCASLMNACQLAHTYLCKWQVRMVATHVPAAGNVTVVQIRHFGCMTCMSCLEMHPTSTGWL